MKTINLPVFRFNTAFILKSVALIIVYVAAAKIGLTFGTINHSATFFWPPGGIALAAVLIGGKRYLPAVFIAACCAGVMVNTPFIFGLGSATGNVLETYLGFSLLQRYGKLDLSLNRNHDLFAIIALGGLIPAIASATLGPISLLASGLINSALLPEIMWRWWKSDVLGIVFFTPLLLSFVDKRPFFCNAPRYWELLAIWVTAIISGQIILLGWAPFTLEQAPSLAWILPTLMWAGLRTGRRNTALIQLLFLGQALSSVYLKTGFFADDFSRYGLSNFWMFAMLVATIGMAFAIMSTAERHRSQKNAQHAKVFEVSHDGVLIVDANNTITSVNSAFTDITGYYTYEEVIGKNPRLLSSGKQSPEFYADMWKTLLALGHWQGEVWNRRKDGSVYLERLTIHTITDANHKVLSRIGNFSDITLQKSTQEAITHQAQHDFLTNLPNRLLFCDRFGQQLAFSTRHQTKFAVIYLDLDKFKPVNDTLGHQVGDQLLVAVAARLSALVREIDTVSRFGGDEFSILVSEVDTINDVTTLADKVVNTLNEPFILDQHTVSVSASLGIALYPDHGADMETIMNNADTAMYQAKRGGHDTYVIATANTAQ